MTLTLSVVQLQLAVPVTVGAGPLLPAGRDGTLQAPEVLTPPGPPSVLLQSLLLRSPANIHEDF